MYKITISDDFGKFKNGVTVDIGKRMEDYDHQGSIICKVAPFIGIPLTLEFAIAKDGKIAFRHWEWNGGGNQYVHTDATNDPADKWNYIEPTAAQIDTVNGMFSGRVLVEGMELSPGKSLQQICPVDVEAEEKRANKKLYIAGIY